MYKKLTIVLILLLNLTSCHKEPTACFEPESSSIGDGYDAKVAEKVTFNNCSSEASLYKWDFGDGETSLTLNPIHAYKTGGQFTVTLSASGNGGDQLISKEINILSLYGNWEGTFTIGTTIFLFYFELEQEGTNIDGNFELEDGSAETSLVSSEIDNDNVSVQFNICYSATTYSFKFEGNVNSTYDHMEGNFLINVEKQGIWSANKYTTKNATIKMDHSCTNDIEKIIQSIQTGK